MFMGRFCKKRQKGVEENKARSAIKASNCNDQTSHIPSLIGVGEGERVGDKVY